MFTLYLKPQNYPSTLLLTYSLIKVPTPHRVTPTSLSSADQRIEGDQAWAQLASTPHTSCPEKQRWKPYKAPETKTIGEKNIWGFQVSM
jgi:hypothetical protein